MKPIPIQIQTVEEDYLRMQIKDDPHTLYNLLRLMALKEKGVVLAGYARDRTFEDSLMFQIRTDGTVDPKKVLVDAARQVAALAESFRQEFEDAYF
ncbi:MAG: RpoL/Rpb11 RNA polymerase subunit family protein [Candidatus Kariarchaeaceae archaeon]|jgi:DNA-directed RNA polymerase subunit L